MMNERIKELAIEAGLEMCSCGCNMPTRQSAMFAELIVKECMQVSLKHSHRDDDMGAIIANKIKKHFGVE